MFEDVEFDKCYIGPKVDIKVCDTGEAISSEYNTFSQLSEINNPFLESIVDFYQKNVNNSTRAISHLKCVVDISSFKGIIKPGSAYVEVDAQAGTLLEENYVKGNYYKSFFEIDNSNRMDFLQEVYELNGFGTEKNEKGFSFSFSGGSLENAKEAIEVITRSMIACKDIDYIFNDLAKISNKLGIELENPVDVSVKAFNNGELDLLSFLDLYYNYDELNAQAGWIGSYK